MKKIKLILSTFIFITSCNQNKLNTNNIFLKGNNYKYWDAYNKDAKNPYGVYRFDKDGSCYFLKYNYDTKPPNLTFFYQDDIAYLPNRYTLSNDSVSIVTDCWVYKVLKVRRDTIELFSLSKSEEIIFIASVFKTDKFNFDSLKKYHIFTTINKI